jgi:hypothetical protein
MGRSVSAPTVLSGGRVVHKLSGSTIEIEARGPVLEHRLYEHGASAKYPVAYSVGAGMVGYSYMVRVRDYLFQSPVSYYTQTKSWDLTPGYETESHLDFTHQITSGCLFCHTGTVNWKQGSRNEFADPAFTPITCERCHGPSAAHSRNPVEGSIVNPAKLLGARRDSVCEQCHLEGEDRVLNPGRDWWDFRAGMATESVFVTYVGGSQRDLKAVSQSELLARSRCARESGGKLWCGTCHSPHGAAKNLKQACLGCHADLFAAGRHAAADGCESCHMPRLRPTNVAHSAVTDHSIPRRPVQSVSAGKQLPPRAWREPEPSLRERDLGIAYFDLAASSHTEPDLREAYRILAHLPPREREDPVVEADLGSILLASGQTPFAIRMFESAAALDRSNARYVYCLGAALERADKNEEAIRELQRSIALDPSQPDAYLELSRVYKKIGRGEESKKILRDYLRLMPQNITIRGLN